MFKQISSILFLILFTSCSLIEYHPYDGRLTIDERDLNNRHMALIEAATQEKDTIRFFWTGDTHKDYDETVDLVNHINNQILPIDFVMHGGDFTEYGLTKEFEWKVSILSKLKIPYVGLLGNHDVIGNGDQVFHTLFGEFDFSFRCGNIKFVCLNTNAIEYDYSEPVPDFDFIRNEIKEAGSHDFTRTIVAMHARPGCEQFNNNVKEFFQYYIKQFPNLLFCLNAHDHQLQAADLFDDGLIYYGCSNIAKRNYMLFTVTPDDYSYEVVYF